MDLAALCRRLPSGKEPPDRAARAELFTRLDSDGDGELTPGDIERGLRALLSAAAKRPVTEPAPPALHDAFRTTTHLMGAPEERHVSRATFRLFLCNLKWALCCGASSNGNGSCGNRNSSRNSNSRNDADNHI